MRKIENAPVVLFVYNRPEHTRKTLDALNKNIGVDESELFIFSDYAKNSQDLKAVLEVRALLKKFKEENHFMQVHICEREQHKGLADSVIEGVTSVIMKYERAIVLEDDLITSIDFLKYMNGALKYYRKDSRVWSISGYTPNVKYLSKYKKDVFMCPRADSWGWATWRDRWESIDWEVGDYTDFARNRRKKKQFRKIGYDMPDMLARQMQGEIDSWAIRFCYEQFKQGKISVNPTVSRVRNIGFDGTGTHRGISKKWDVYLNEEMKDITYIPVGMNRKLMNSWYTFFAGNLFYRKYSSVKSFAYNIFCGKICKRR